MNHLESVRELMSLVFGVPPEQITPETTQANLSAWDSVGHLNLMLALEETFRITLAVDEIRRLTSVADILEHLDATCPSH
jgi:acyl carrier protein